jgi:beta-galactosidase
MHRLLYRNNVGVDFIFPENADFKAYDLVIIPSLYIASDDLLKKISDYVKSGGHVIMQFKSGFCDENSMVRPVLAPGPLREACGFYYQEFSNISELALKGDPFKVGVKDNRVYDWAEYIITETAKPVAFYDHPHFGKYPAVTINRFGEGTLVYEGCSLSDKIQEKIFLEALKRAGIFSTDQQLRWPLIVKSGTNTNGEKIYYFYNYSSAPRDFKYPYKKGTELISGNPLNEGQNLSIKPWDVLIVEEL